MSTRYGLVVCSLLVGGCMMGEEDNRFEQFKTQHEAQMKELQDRLAVKDQDLSRQANEELDLRRRLARSNEQLAESREQERQAQAKVDSLQQTTQTLQKRLETFEADRRKDLEQLNNTNNQTLAERDAQINKLKERIRQLEDLLARSAMPPRTTSSSPSR